MKLKFYLLTILLLFSRVCDFYSTGLWFFDNQSGERNSLTRFFDVGFTGLITANIIIVALVIYAFYRYSFKYSINILTSKPEKLTDYISESYFSEKGKFFHIFYRTPADKNILIAHSGYILIRVIIFGSFLATFHNLCQFYNVAFYNTFREIVKRPLFIIYALILLSAGYFAYRLWKSEFETAKRISDAVQTTEI